MVKRLAMCAAMITLLLGALLACKDGGAGCEKDTDCKGARVCVQNRCVEAASAPARPQPTAAPKPPKPAEPAPAVPAADADAGGDESMTYETRLSAQDHFSSKGVRLTRAEQIILQDRSNLYMKRTSDSDDRNDPWFANYEQRTRICNHGQVEGDAARIIVNREPRVSVQVNAVGDGYVCHVTVLDGGNALSDTVPAGGCILDGVIRDSEGGVWGCVGGGNWCANQAAQPCPR